MKILLYGFKPYLNFRWNISEKVVKRIKPRDDLVKVIFPVRFDRKLFLRVLEKEKPNTVLGLGQTPKGNKIRIERKAKNLRKENGEKVILKDGPEYQFANLELERDDNSQVSFDAGEYVCNFSMYLMIDGALRRGMKFAFLHIPMSFDLKKAVEFVERKIDEIEKSF